MRDDLGLADWAGILTIWAITVGILAGYCFALSDVFHERRMWWDRFDDWLRERFGRGDRP